MKVAIPTSAGRISPVFDVARHLLVVDVEGGGETSRHEEPILETHLVRRAARVAGIGVRVLICGAITTPLEAMLRSAGVQVISHTCGPTEEVLRAFITGQWTQQAFLMPGCRGQGRRPRGRRRRGGP